jgi:hypothetical protein
LATLALDVILKTLMRIKFFLAVCILMSCNSESNSKKLPGSSINTQTDSLTSKSLNSNHISYTDQLEETKNHYPFARWHKMFFPDPNEPDSEGMEQYTQENCDKASAIFDNLINSLKTIGKQANEQSKIELFKKAVLSLNKLNNEIGGLIETGEREDLCELIDRVTIAAGLNPKNYAGGDGIADQWRDW